jgi:hypothetical protein
MLEMPVKEVRRPDVHLPEVHLPDLHLPDSVTNFEWPRIELPSVDVAKAVGDAGKAVGEAGRNAGKAVGEAVGEAGKAVSDAAAGVHLGRRSQTPRWPFAIVGLLAAAAAGWVILTNAALRTRLASGTRAVRRQASTLRATLSSSLAARREDPVAFPAAPTAAMEGTGYGDGTGDATDYPDGLGSNNGHGTLADEEITAGV